MSHRPDLPARLARRSVVALGSSAVLLVGALTIGAGAASAATTLVVGDPASCAGATYPTITSAVAVAQPGDTIQVCPGTYRENVLVDTADLTFLGAQAGKDATHRQNQRESIVTNPAGEFTLTPNADGTTINGFTLQGSAGGYGVADFAGSSGLTMVDNIVSNNLEGMNIQNPDGSQPALISQNAFLDNNAGGGVPDNGETGTGVFISNGPANNTTISSNLFTLDTQTAINFAGDATRPSTGLLVSNNQSVNDSTFVVATNSSGAVIDGNTVRTDDNAVPGGQGHGTGILDFGANDGLMISNNSMTANSPTSLSSGISVSNYAGPSTRTYVWNNSVSGWYNDIKMVAGHTDGLVFSNHVSKAPNDGIINQSGNTGVTFMSNEITTAAHYSCEDQSTPGANTWSGNHASTASSPSGICSKK